MNKIHKATFVIFAFIASTAYGEDILLYQLPKGETSFLVNRTFYEGGFTVTEVVLAQHVSIKQTNGVCNIALTNAGIFQAKWPRVPGRNDGTNIVQQSFQTDIFEFSMRRGDHIVFKGKVYDAISFSEPLNRPDMIEYRGEDADKVLKNLGICEGASS